jgi:hypothetical protein
LPFTKTQKLESFVISDTHTSNSDLNVNSQPSASGVHIFGSSSEGNLHHVIPVETNHFSESRSDDRQGTNVGVVLTDALVKVALQAEVEHALSQCNVTGCSVVAKKIHET